MSAAMLDLNTGKVGNTGSVPVIYLEDSWTSVLCDVREWMINNPVHGIPAAFITFKGDVDAITELLVIGDQKDIEWWEVKLTFPYFIVQMIGNSLTISYDKNAGPATGTPVILAQGTDAAGRSTCYGNIKGGKRSDEGEFDETQKGGGGGGSPGPGGGGGGGPPSPHDTTLGSGDSDGEGQGDGEGDGEGGEGGESGQGEGEGESDGEGGECTTCDGTGMGSGPGADDGGESDGSESGESGSGDGEGSDPEGSGAPGEGTPSEDGQGSPPEMCGDCNGTGCETPIDDLADNIGEEGMSPTQEAADAQAAEDFAKQQADCSEQCAKCADEAEQAKEDRDVETAIESAQEAQEVGNPRSKQDNDNMARAKDAAHDAIEEAWDESRITEDQAKALHDDVDAPIPSNQSEAQKMAQEARQEANEAFDKQDADKLQEAADKAEAAAEEVKNRNDAGSVRNAAKDIADIAQNAGQEGIEEQMRDLADEMQQRAQETSWGIKDTKTGEFLKDDQGSPAEFGSPEEAEEVLEEMGNPKDMEVAPIPNKLDESMNKAKESLPELDIDDLQTRDEFSEQYDRTMDDLSEGEICTVTNLDGVFAPTAGDTYTNLINYATLMNEMIGGMMAQSKEVPVLIAVLSEQKPLGLYVLQGDDHSQEKIDELLQGKYTLHSKDRPKKGEVPKWAAFTYDLTPTLDSNFGINSQVRILEDNGYWVKVRPLSNAKGFMPLLKANLDCYDEEAIPSELQDIIDTPHMPTTPQDLQTMLDEARRRRARKKRTHKISGDAQLEYRVDIITGERRSFDKSQLLAGEAGRTFVQIHRNMGVLSDLEGLMTQLDKENINYKVLQQKVGPTQIETDAQGIRTATQLGTPLVVRGNKVGYL